MPQTQVQGEPSMEEILASIRRIISEEEGGSEEVLDLTQTAEADMGGDSDDLLVFDAEPAKPTPPPRAAAPPPARAEAPSMAPTMPADSLVSAQAVTATSGALTRLAGALRIAETPGQTIEGVVREMLKPMLREWLDQHLPAIVEAKVEAELERIARLTR